jgi:hypothetical protein
MMKCWFVMAVVMCGILAPVAHAEKAEPVSIIFDTDMDTDCDDMGAMAMLHALADAGEAKILATVVSSHYPYSAPCVEAVNRHYGRGDLPIGAPKQKGASIHRGSRYAKAIAERYDTSLKTNDDADDAVDVYRRVLAAAPDQSVVVVTVGYVTNLRYLLTSKPDPHSDLDGMALVKKKVARWVCMGGRYPEHLDPAEYGNFKPDPAAIVEAAANWPTTIYFCGLGTEVGTGYSLDKTPADNPVRVAYKLYLGKNPTRPSWDQTATLFAIRPNAAFWKLRTKGSNHIFENGTNRWVDEPDIERHVLIEYAADDAAGKKRVVRQLTDTIEHLMTRPPAGK